MNKSCCSLFFLPCSNASPTTGVALILSHPPPRMGVLLIAAHAVLIAGYELSASDFTAHTRSPSELRREEMR